MEETQFPSQEPDLRSAQDVPVDQTLTMLSSSLARSIGLLRPLKDVTVTAGETATFECELSYEGIVVDWFLGKQKMEASERVSQSAYLFEVRLFNEPTVSLCV